MTRSILGLITLLTCAVFGTELFAQAGQTVACGAPKSAIHRYNVLHV